MEIIGFTKSIRIKKSYYQFKTDIIKSNRINLTIINNQFTYCKIIIIFMLLLLLLYNILSEIFFTANNNDKIKISK